MHVQHLLSRAPKYSIARLVYGRFQDWSGILDSAFVQHNLGMDDFVDGSLDDLLKSKIMTNGSHMIIHS